LQECGELIKVFNGCVRMNLFHRWHCTLGIKHFQAEDKYS